MGAKKLLNTFLGLLTPENIAEMGIVADGKNKVDLTDLMSTFLDEHSKSIKKRELGSAKILPFKKKGDEDRDDIALENPNKQVHSDNLIKLKEYQQSAKKELLEKEVTELATTQFIIREKEKLQESQKKLKKKEVLTMYAKESKVNVEQEKLNKEDMTKSANIGVLVNRRQF